MGPRPIPTAPMPDCCSGTAVTGTGPTAMVGTPAGSWATAATPEVPRTADIPSLARVCRAITVRPRPTTAAQPQPTRARSTGRMAPTAVTPDGSSATAVTAITVPTAFSAVTAATAGPAARAARSVARAVTAATAATAVTRRR